MEQELFELGYYLAIAQDAIGELKTEYIDSTMDERVKWFFDGWNYTVDMINGYNK